MKRIVVILLLANITWLANAAALDPADQQPSQPVAAQQHTLLDQEMPKELRADIIAKGKPELVDFLLRRGNNYGARQEIPNFGAFYHDLAISNNCSKLVIIPMSDPKIPNDPNRPGEMIIWDLESDELLHHINLPHPIVRVRVTPWGKNVITVDTSKNVSIWDVNNGEKLHDLGPCCHPTRSLFACNCGAKKLLATLDDFIRVWDVETGLEVSRFAINGVTARAGSISLSPDGTKVALSCANESVIKILDTKTGHELLTVPVSGCMAIEFCSDNKTIECIGSEWINNVNNNFHCVWDISTGKLLSKQGDGADLQQINGNLRIAAKSNGCLEIFDRDGHFLCQEWTNNVQNPNGSKISENWYCVTEDHGCKIYAWNLKKCVQQNNELIQELGKLSERQLWFLIKKVMKAAAKYRKLGLNRSNPLMAETIRDYELLPEPIKERVKAFVKLVNVNVGK